MHNLNENNSFCVIVENDEELMLSKKRKGSKMGMFTPVGVLCFQENVEKYKKKKDVFDLCAKLSKNGFSWLNKLRRHTSRYTNLCTVDVPSMTQQEKGQYYKARMELMGWGFYRVIPVAAGRILYGEDFVPGTLILNPHWFIPSVDPDMVHKNWECMKNPTQGQVTRRGRRSEK